MPKVPVETPQIPTDVPAVTTDARIMASFGHTGSAIERAGAEISGSAETLLGHVKQMEAQDASSQAYYQDKIDSEEKISELRLNSPDGYVHDKNPDGSYAGVSKNPDGSARTITQEFHDWANQRFQSNQDAMPSRMAQELYKQRSQPYIEDQVLNIHSDQQKSMISAHAQTVDDAVRVFGDQLQSTPKINDAYSHSNDLTSDINKNIGKLYNSTAAKEKIEKVNSSIARDLVEGGYTQVLAGGKSDATRIDQINYWRSVLSGEDSDSKRRSSMGLETVSTMLSPQDKARLEDKILHLTPVAKSHDLSDLNESIKQISMKEKQGDVKGSAGLVGDIGMETLGIISSVKSAINEGDMGFVVGATHIGEILASHEIGRLAGPSFDALSTNQQQSMMQRAIERAGSNLSSLGLGEKIDPIAKEKIKEVFFSQINSDKAKKDSDFVKFAGTPNSKLSFQPTYQSVSKAQLAIDTTPLSNIGQISNTIRAALPTLKTAYMNEYGRPIESLVSKDTSQKWGKELSDPNIPSNITSQSITGLKQAYGHDFPNVINQMIADKNLPERWRISGYLPPGGRTTELADAIKGNSANEQSFKIASEAAGGTMEKDLSAAVGAKMSKFISATMQSNHNNVSATEMANGFTQVLKSAAINAWRSDSKASANAGSSDIKEYVDKAYDRIITPSVHIEEMGTGWHLFSKTMNGIPSQVIIPKTYNGQMVGDDEKKIVTDNLNQSLSSDKLKSLGLQIPGGLPDGIKDKFYDFAAKNSRWNYTTIPEPGYNIEWKSPVNGSKQTGKGKDGNEFFVPYSSVRYQDAKIEKAPTPVIAPLRKMGK